MNYHVSVYLVYTGSARYRISSENELANSFIGFVISSKQNVIGEIMKRKEPYLLSFYWISSRLSPKPTYPNPKSEVTVLHCLDKRHQNQYESKQHRGYWRRYSEAFLCKRQQIRLIQTIWCAYISPSHLAAIGVTRCGTLLSTCNLPSRSVPSDKRILY